MDINLQLEGRYEPGIALGQRRASHVGSDAIATTFLGLAGAVFMFALAVHASGRSGSHGAGAFAAYSAVAGLRLLIAVALPLLPQPWATGAGVLRHLTVWIGPLLGLLFALRFANAVSGARRRGAGAFWAAGVVVVAVVVTNPIHGLYLRSPWRDNAMDFGPLGWSMVAITNVAVLAVVVLLVAAMARAEGRRGPLALVIAGAVLAWFATTLPVFAWSPFVFGQVDVVMRAAAAGLYAVALFGFGLLRLVPIGRAAVLRRMDDGWLVLDPTGRIADLNPAAERMFGVSARAAIGREALSALRHVAGLDAVWRGDAAEPRGADVRATVGGPERQLDVHVTPVLSPRGSLLGKTLLVRDVTALRRAEALALERERALAALQERERVARELHDGLAQVLGFVRLQAEAARGLLRRDATTAEAYLSRLAETALEAHGEVRSFIAGSAAGSQVGWSTAIAATVRRVGEETGLDVEFSSPEGLDDDALAPPVGAHLVRIVQEALHNVRKHARARRVAVAVAADDAWVEVVIVDDGAGLAEPTAPPAGPGYGIRFMHERAATAGGSLAIESGVGEGTRVTVRMPRRDVASVANGLAAVAGRGGG
jgi:PAS domain S-box-containing protein